MLLRTNFLSSEHAFYISQSGCVCVPVSALLLLHTLYDVRLQQSASNLDLSLAATSTTHCMLPATSYAQLTTFKSIKFDLTPQCLSVLTTRDRYLHCEP